MALEERLGERDAEAQRLRRRVDRVDREVNEAVSAARAAHATEAQSQLARLGESMADLNRELSGFSEKVTVAMTAAVEIPAGYPSADETVDLLLAMSKMALDALYADYDEDALQEASARGR